MKQFIQYFFRSEFRMPCLDNLFVYFFEWKEVTLVNRNLGFIYVRANAPNSSYSFFWSHSSRIIKINTYCTEILRKQLKGHETSSILAVDELGTDSPRIRWSKSQSYLEKYDSRPFVFAPSYWETRCNYLDYQTSL